MQPRLAFDKVFIFRASYWFSLPFAYKRKQVEGSALVEVADLETSVRSTATLRAGAQLNVSKALKGVWGKNKSFSPTSNISSSLFLSSKTVRWTVFEA